jgi:hypothetical protein
LAITTIVAPLSTGVGTGIETGQSQRSMHVRSQSS